MKTLTIREFRANIGHLNQLVEQTGEMIITRHGKPILRVLPIQAKYERPDHNELRKKMPFLATPSSHYINEDRDDR